MRFESPSNGRFSKSGRSSLQFGSCAKIVNNVLTQNGVVNRRTVFANSAAIVFGVKFPALLPDLWI